MLSSIASGIMSIIFWLFRVVILGIILGINLIISTALSIGTSDFKFIDIKDIIFNRLRLIGIDFFSETGSLAGMSVPIANIYMLVLGLSIAIQIIVLLYVAIQGIIRILQISPYVDKAKQKADMILLLENWVKGIMIIVGISIFIVAVIQINNAIVDVLFKTFVDASTPDVFDQIHEKIFDLDIMMATSAFLLFIMLMINTYALLFQYVKRMIKVAFLIIIAPLIATTYAIDKVKDGKSQVLDAWTKEFVSTVTVQIVHALLYIIIIGITLSNQKTFSFAAMFLSVLSINFIFTAEKLVQSIFGVQSTIMSEKGTLIGTYSKIKFLSTAGAKLLKNDKVKNINLKLKSTKLDKLKNDVGKKINENKIYKGAANITGKIGETKDKIIEKKDHLVDNVNKKIYRARAGVIKSAYKFVGLNAPVKRLKEQIDRHEQNVDKKRKYKKYKKAKSKKIKKPKKLIGKVAVGTLAAAGNVALKMSTEDIYNSNLTKTAITGYMAGSATADVRLQLYGERLQDKNERILSKEEDETTASYKKVENRYVEKAYVNMENKRRILEDSNNEVTDFDDKLIHEFNLSTHDGRKNYEEYANTLDLYAEGKDKAKAARMEEIIKERAVAQEKEFIEFLQKKQKKTKEEVMLILSDLQGLVKNNVKINFEKVQNKKKINSFDTDEEIANKEKFNNRQDTNIEMRKYISALLDENQITMAKQFNNITSNISSSYKSIHKNIMDIDKLKPNIKNKVDKEKDIELDMFLE